MDMEMRLADDRARLFHHRCTGTLRRMHPYVGMMVLGSKSKYWLRPLISCSDGNRELNR